MTTPNLLFLFTDEQRADTLGACGNDRIHTPHLDRLASESVVFDRAYVTQPVCTPSRATLLTGLYPHTSRCTANNVPLAADVPAFPELLPPGRWTSAYFGKWHLGDEIFRQHGFDAWRSIEDMYVRHYGPGRDRDARSDYHHFLTAQGYVPRNGSHFTRTETAKLPEELSKPAYLAREASRFIRDHRDRPFCLFVNFLEPHMPFTGPRDDQYDPADVTLPDNYNDLPALDQPLKTRLFHRHYREKGHGGFPLHTEAHWRDQIRRYWGLCSLVDTHVGTILRTLTECALDESTIVVYTSDHGDMMGSHRLLAKCVMFEEAVRVPMMVRLPGQHAARRVTDPVSQVDLVPTLLELMGQPVPRHLEGRSLAGLLTGEHSKACRDVFIEWNGADGGIDLGGSQPFRLPEHLRDLADDAEALSALGDPVRTVLTPDGWKFNCSMRGEHELYNLNDDPCERRNLAREPELLPRREDLFARLRAWQERTRDNVALPRPT